MFARSVMVVGKLLTAVALVVSTPAHSQIVVPESVYNLGMALNRLFDRVTEDERTKFQAAIHTALANLDNGEVIKWYSNTSYNHATIEIVGTSQLSGRLCRRFYAEFNTERSTQHFEKWGCYDESTKTWRIHN